MNFDIVHSFNINRQAIDKYLYYLDFVKDQTIIKAVSDKDYKAIHKIIAMQTEKTIWFQIEMLQDFNARETSAHLTPDLRQKKRLNVFFKLWVF